MVNRGIVSMTYTSDAINSQADSLIELLVAQCADLESLLKLARQESLAVEENDFDRMLAVTSERSILGERLENYHRQISDLRAAMGESADQVLRSTLVKDTIRLALEIESKDAHTSSSLTSVRSNTNCQLTRLEQGRKNSTAYLSEGHIAGIKCDRRA